MPRIREYNLPALGKLSFEAISGDDPHRIAVDTETTGVGYYDEPFCVTMTWRSREGRLRNGYFEIGDIDFEEDHVRTILDQLRRHEDAELIFHNAKFDLHKLINYGMMERDWFAPHQIHDTEGIYHLLYPNDPKKLKTLAVEHLGRGMVQVPYVSGKKKGQLHWVMKEDHELAAVRRKLGLKKSDGYHLLPRVNVVPYSMKDTEYTYRLYELGYPKLRDDVLELYAQEQKVCFALLRMEDFGLRVRVDYLEDETSKFGVKIMEEHLAIQALDASVNPDAPATILASLRGRGHKIDNTEAKTLLKLDDDLARRIVHYRQLTKMHKTYLRGLLNEQRDGIIHPWIRQHGARTGRTSSGTAKPDG